MDNKLAETVSVSATKRPSGCDVNIQSSDGKLNKSLNKLTEALTEAVNSTSSSLSLVSGVVVVCGLIVTLVLTGLSITTVYMHYFY